MELKQEDGYAPRTRPYLASDIPSWGPVVDFASLDIDAIAAIGDVDEVVSTPMAVPPPVVSAEWVTWVSSGAITDSLSDDE